MRQYNLRIEIIAFLSPPIYLLSGRKTSHKIQGMGTEFAYKIFNHNVVDEIVIVANDSAMRTSCKIARHIKNIRKPIVTDTGEKIPFRYLFMSKNTFL